MSSTIERQVAASVSALGTALARGPQRVTLPEPTICIGDPLTIATYRNSQGIVTLRVFSSEDSAYEWQVELAKDNWDTDICGPLLSDFTAQEIVDLYFDAMAVYRESFDTTVVELQP